MPFVRRFVAGVVSFIRSRWKLLLILILIAALVGFYFYRRNQAAAPTYKFVRPEVRDLTKTLEVSGVVDAKQKANLRFALGGKLVYLGAKEGDWVKKHQTIATIDQRELQKRLKQDLNAYVRERWDWETTQDQTDYNVEPLETRRSLDQQQTQLNDTVLNVEIQDIAISNTYLTAPFAGILVSTPVTTPGVNIAATEAFELVDPDTLVFKAAVDEADIATVSLDQPAQIELDAYPDKPFASYISAIGFKSQQSSSGSIFVVELPIEGEDLLNRYRLGMNGDVTIKLETKPSVLVIPLDATRQRDESIFVDIRTGENTVEEREIKIGLETDEYVEVLSGLTVDDEVVLPE
jgi:RND family efflux transporter MFP subunit